MQRTPHLFGWLLAAAFMVLLNETTVGVALPTLMTAFDQPATAAQWLVSGYLLALGCVLPLAGTIIERLGTTRTLAVSAAAFLAGSVLALCATELWMLVVARVVQAAGGAAAIPLLTSTVMREGPRERRGRTMGVVAFAIGAAPALGPTVSGLLLALGGWRLLFAPSALLCVAVLIRVLPLCRRPGSDGTTLARADVLSVLLAVFSIGAVTLALDSAFGEGIDSVAALVLAVTGIAAGIAFARRQLGLAARGLPPVLDLRTLRVPRLVRGMTAVLVGMCGLFGVFALLPVEAGTRLGLSALTTGLLMLPGGLLMAVLAPVVGRIAERVPPRSLAVVGFAVMAFASAGFAYLEPGREPLLLALHISLSIGFAFAITPLYLDALDQQPPSAVPHATALISTTQQVAAAAGTIVIIAVASRSSSAGFFATAGLLAGAAVVMAVLPTHRRRTGSQPFEPE